MIQLLGAVDENGHALHLVTGRREEKSDTSEKSKKEISTGYCD